MSLPLQLCVLNYYTTLHKKELGFSLAKLEQKRNVNLDMSAIAGGYWQLCNTHS